MFYFIFMSQIIGTAQPHRRRRWRALRWHRLHGGGPASNDVIWRQTRGRTGRDEGEGDWSLRHTGTRNGPHTLSQSPTDFYSRRDVRMARRQTDGRTNRQTNSRVAPFSTRHGFCALSFHPMLVAFFPWKKTRNSRSVGGTVCGHDGHE